MPYALSVRGGFQQVFHHPSDVSAMLGFALELQLLSGGRASYSFRVRRNDENSRSGGWAIVEEECRVFPATGEGENAFFRVDNGTVTSSLGMMPGGTVDRLYLVRASGVSQFREVYDAFCDMQFYKIVPGRIPDLDTNDLEQRLRQDGSNVASVIKVLHATDPGAHARLLEFLWIVLPTLKKVRVNPVEAGEGNEYLGAPHIALRFQQKVGQSMALFRPSQMSEGTLRTLALFTALYQVDVRGRRPALTAIEDVEAAIHPGALRVVLDALQEASLTTQVLVATHSPELLDEKDVAAESILAVTADDGVTHLGPLADEDRAVVRDRLFTVGQLLRATRLEPAGQGDRGAHGALQGFEEADA